MSQDRIEAGTTLAIVSSQSLDDLDVNSAGVTASSPDPTLPIEVVGSPQRRRELQEQNADLVNAHRTS